MCHLLPGHRPLLECRTEEGYIIGRAREGMLTEETIIELSFLTDETAVPTVDDLSLPLLRHHASAIRYQKFHGVDIITVQVEGS